MSVVREVADLLKLVGDGIKNIREIIKAARDGFAYLNRHHPDAQKDLADLLEELGKLVQLLAEASSIVTHFDFTVTGSAVDQEPREFNKLLIEHKGVFQRFQDQLDRTRAHCSKIGYHHAALQAKAAQHGFHDLFGLLKTPQKRAQKLADLLRNLYGSDNRLLGEFQNMAEAVSKALDDVRTALGPPGRMLVKNVPNAARLLGKHARNFRPVEADALYALRQLRETVVDLTTVAPPKTVAAGTSH